VAWLVEVPTTLDLRENLQENAIFHGKNQFPVDSTNQSIENSRISWPGVTTPEGGCWESWMVGSSPPCWKKW
jgi:hypothetical protein